MKKFLASLGLIFLILTLYAGLFLLGWGLGDLSGFFSEPARAAYIAFIVLMALATPFLARLIPEGIGDKGREEKHRTRQDVAWAIARPILVILILAVPYCDRHDILTMPESSSLRWAGMALVVAGFLLITWTTVELGRQYSVYITLQQDHQLITSGPYQYIRHPLYSSLLLLAWGIFFKAPSWTGGALVAVATGFLILTAAIGIRLPGAMLFVTALLGP
jgi:protein-S-isoprenylcysteine O-methyltransferase Ste14